jgi:hypothetical protein
MPDTDIFALSAAVSQTEERCSGCGSAMNKGLAATPNATPTTSTFHKTVT